MKPTKFFDFAIYFLSTFFLSCIYNINLSFFRTVYTGK